MMYKFAITPVQFDGLVGAAYQKAAKAATDESVRRQLDDKSASSADEARDAAYKSAAALEDGDFVLAESLAETALRAAGQAIEACLQAQYDTGFARGWAEREAV